MSNDRYNDQDTHDLDETFENDYADQSDDDASSSVEDEWEDDVDSEDSSDPYTPPPKKKKSLGNVLIIGVAVVAGLIFMVFKFGGGSSTEAPATPPTDSVAEAVSSVPVDTAQPSPESVVPTPQEAPLESVGQDQLVSSLPDGSVASPTSDTNVGPLTPMPAETPVTNSDVAAVDVAPTAEVPAMAPPSGQPSPAPQLMTAVPDMAVPDASVAPAALGQQDQVPSLVGQGEQSSEPSNEGSQPLQPVSDFPSADMIKKVDTTAPESIPADQPQIDSVAALPSQSVPAEEPLAHVVGEKSSDPSSELTAALEKIKQLEDAAEKNDQIIEEYKGQVSSLKQEIDDLKLKEENPPVRVEKVKKQTESPVEQVRPSEPVPAKWILKGAQSGRALLASQGASQGDVRTVSVGDKVSGLGTILSIEKSQSGWVVLGTLGRVSQ